MKPEKVSISRAKLGWAISLIVCVWPLLLWLPRQPFNQYFISEAVLYGTIGKICALVGTAMFAWSLILSARLRPIEKLFHGLDKEYQAHKIFGTVSLGLLILHPIFLTFRAYYSRSSFYEVWVELDYLPLVLGRVALAGMLGVIIGTVFFRLRHQTFITIHRTLGAFFLVGAVHAFGFPGGQIGVNQPLRWYMLLLTAFAGAAYFHHTVLGQVLRRRYKYSVDQVVTTQGVTIVTLKPLGRPMVFAPGQFAFVSFHAPGMDEEAHPFSFCSGNGDPYLRFAIKALGDDTARMPVLQAGMPVTVEGPYGGFSHLNARKKHQVWVAGGIGITPFISMARSLRPNYAVDLYYCVKEPSEAVFLDELREVAAANPSFRVFLFDQPTYGFISAEAIVKGSGGLADKSVLICGPPVMMESLSKQLKAAGLPEGRVHFEEFAF